MRRGLVLAAIVALCAACGGGEAGVSDDGPAAKPVAATPQPAVVADPVPNEPTPEQLATRERLLKELAAGTYDCDCTGTARALDRIRPSPKQP